MFAGGQAGGNSDEFAVGVAQGDAAQFESGGDPNENNRSIAEILHVFVMDDDIGVYGFDSDSGINEQARAEITGGIGLDDASEGGLGLGVDEGIDIVDFAVGVRQAGVFDEADVLTYADLREVFFVDLQIDPDGAEIGDNEDFGVLFEDFAEGDMFFDNRAVEGRDDLVIGKQFIDFCNW